MTSANHRISTAAFIAVFTLITPAFAQAPTPQVVSPEVGADHKITFRILAPKPNP